ncbi:MAG TPA: hypothetical protein VGM83_18700 [Devosiaceae bacterium]|jgi:hypothetical protein
MRLRLLMACGLALLMSALPAAAQTTPSATLVLPSPDGATTQTYAVDDISVSLARSSYDALSEPVSDIGVTISTVRPVDSFLLEWINQRNTGRDALRDITLTVPATGGLDTAFVYALKDARVSAFSASHSLGSGSGFITLTLNARTMTLNGVSMN